MITRKEVVEQLNAYLNHRVSLEALVDWAEQSLLHGGLEDGYESVLREALGRIGLADVKAFGLLWEDCEQLLNMLGYGIHVEVYQQAA